jgi:ABC-type amino acid transport substrate-binding protein
MIATMTKFSLIFSIFFYMGTSAFSQSTDVVYPHPPVLPDERANYAIEVIKLALFETQDDYGAWTVHYSADPMERPRMEAAVEKGVLAQVIMLPGSNAYDERFILVPIPIDKGLIGYRVSLIHRSNRTLFQRVASLSDVKNAKACLARSWNITKVFEDNGLQVVKSDKFSDLFKLLHNNRCDYFSRGVGEIQGELAFWSNTYRDIAIDPYVLLRTPMAFYLYVSKSHPELAKRLEVGMRRALEDGRFDELFHREFKSNIDALKMRGRKVIELKMRQAHKKAPLGDPHLWFHP